MQRLSFRINLLVLRERQIKIEHSALIYRSKNYLYISKEDTKNDRKTKEKERILA